MTEVVIVGATRTPMGKFLGRVSQFTATQLGAAAIKGLLEKTGVAADQIDEVMLGHVVQAGVGQAPARQASIRGGVPASVPAVAINKVCGSGMKAIIAASQAIRCGDAQAVIAGGMESMSNAPYLAFGLRQGVKAGDQKLADSMIHDGLWCAFEKHHMGLSAEYTAKKSGITRRMQDELALHSHQKALKAMESGAFKDELIPLQASDGPIAVDETPRADSSLEKLGKLKPAFSADGTVTAGNAPGLNDGASALLLMSENKA
ncbi:MAG TPA: acetyl-CoA C-acyltransferase, partial [Candidatus Bipolaricaulota bacterium]